MSQSTYCYNAAFTYCRSGNLHHLPLLLWAWVWRALSSWSLSAFPFTTYIPNKVTLVTWNFILAKWRYHLFTRLLCENLFENVLKLLRHGRCVNTVIMLVTLFSLGPLRVGLCLSKKRHLFAENEVQWKKIAFLLQLINWNWDSDLGHRSHSAVTCVNLIQQNEIYNNFKVKNIPDLIPFYYYAIF